jgi:glycosyltransferase involved in cell wall biosynthesis
MLATGMTQKGHDVQVIRPRIVFAKFAVFGFMKKWLQYIDSLIVFPNRFKKIVAKSEPNNLFVFTDNALGPWIPIVKDFPNVVHCHDFLAYFSAMGKLPENPTSKTGKIYQNLIIKGFKQASSFISVSEKTRTDLHGILGQKPLISEVVYNGLSPVFKPVDKQLALEKVSQICNRDFPNGFILNIGVNVWYKNKLGLLRIYNAWRSNHGGKLPLVLIGPSISDELASLIEKSPFKNDIILLDKLSDDEIIQFYSAANLMLFPSLYEGFGWPIAEALACKCPVLTTQEAPMNEVGAEHAYYISRMPSDPALKSTWATTSAKELDRVLKVPSEVTATKMKSALEYVEQFDQNKAIDKIENIYQQVLMKHQFKNVDYK